MKKYLLLTFSCAFLAGCATLDPVYEKLNAQVAAFKKVVNPAAPVPAASAAAQESSRYFFEGIWNCWVDPRFNVDVSFDRRHHDYESDDDKLIEKSGMIGMLWGRGKQKLVWAKPEKIRDGSYRLVFPGRKPMVITQIVGKIDPERPDLSGPEFSIQELGRKKWLCGEVME